jgi:molybdopterin molybdotransferase
VSDERLLTVEEALDQVLAGVSAVAERERLTPEAALGRVVAEHAVAATSLPPWDNSAMDGYAIQASDTSGATGPSPATLDVVGEVPAGSASADAVAPRRAIRIATGAPVPRGADAVVPVEATSPVDAAGRVGGRGRDATGPLPARILVHEVVSPGGSIRRAGSDVEAGALLRAPGEVVTPAAVALLAGSGVTEVVVRRSPMVGVLATGDEVRGPGEALGDAGIPDANGPGIRSLVRQAGAQALELGIAKDRLEDVADRLQRAIDAGADAIIVSGGVSVGPYDVVRLAFEQAAGAVSLWRVAVQPGKPFAFARVAGGSRPVLLFGLPGNPVSSFVTFELFVRPALRRLAGHRVRRRPRDRAVLEDPVTKRAGRRGFQRVMALRDGDGGPERDAAGRVRVRLAGGQGSHVMSALAAADALAVVPESVDRLPAGAEVELRWLDRG